MQPFYNYPSHYTAKVHGLRNEFSKTVFDYVHSNTVELPLHGVLKGTWKDEISGQVNKVSLSVVNDDCLNILSRVMFLNRLPIIDCFVDLPNQMVPELTVWKRETQKFALKKLVDVGLLEYTPCYEERGFLKAKELIRPS